MIIAIVGCLIATLAIITALLAIACVRTQKKPCSTENKEKNWTVVEWEYDDNGAQELHVLPNNDHIVHEIPGDHCPCGAHWERENGITLYTHHSLDGREHNE